MGWIEAANNYIRLHAGQGSYLLRETMSGFLAKLYPGEKVEFDVVQGQKGPAAENVRRLGA